MLEPRGVYVIVKNQPLMRIIQDSYVLVIQKHLSKRAGKTGGMQIGQEGVRCQGPRGGLSLLPGRRPAEGSLAQGREESSEPLRGAHGDQGRGRRVADTTTHMPSGQRRQDCIPTPQCPPCCVHPRRPAKLLKPCGTQKGPQRARQRV